MAHLSDNAGIQAHSAGPHFPFVIVVTERDGEPATRRYRVTGPATPEIVRHDGFAYLSADSAEREATALARWYHRNRRSN